MGDPLKLDAVGTPLPETAWTYGWKDCALYALGVGETDLRYTWEGHPDFAVLPTLAVLPTMPGVMAALKVVGADYRRLVHGGQSIRLHRPIPRGGTLVTQSAISAVQDKGKGGVVIIDTATADADGPLFETSWSIFCRGQGGFGGPRGEKPVLPDVVEGAAAAVDAAYDVRPDQALLYRLSGDLNPLHVDPQVATAVGFDAPILHGLCTYAFAARAAIAQLADGDPHRLARFDARFSGVVYPGETLQVRAFPTHTHHSDMSIYRLDANVADRGVLSHGVASVRRSD